MVAPDNPPIKLEGCLDIGLASCYEAYNVSSLYIKCNMIYEYVPEYGVSYILTITCIKTKSSSKCSKLCMRTIKD